jgi:hypothetical protein
LGNNRIDDPRVVALEEMYGEKEVVWIFLGRMREYWRQLVLIETFDECGRLKGQGNRNPHEIL